MNAIMNIFAEKCVMKGYIPKDRVPSLLYPLDRKLAIILVGIPSFIVGSIISSPIITMFFWFGFYFLRSRISGYHTKNIETCLAGTLFLEWFFLDILFEVLHGRTIAILLVLAFFLIVLLSPYKDPCMNFSEEEVRICSCGAKTRVVILFALIIYLYLNNYYHLARGVALGIVMAASLLALAYIKQKI